MADKSLGVPAEEKPLCPLPPTPTGSQEVEGGGRGYCDCHGLQSWKTGTADQSSWPSFGASKSASQATLINSFYVQSLVEPGKQGIWRALFSAKGRTGFFFVSEMDECGRVGVASG